MGSDGNPLARHGRLSYLEIPARDAARAAAFYAHVFGWRIDDRGGGDFRFGDGDGLLIGRFARERAAGEGFVPYVYVDGVDAAVARAAAHGGELVQAPYAEGDLRVARVRDPAGNLVGLWQLAAG